MQLRRRGRRALLVLLAALAVAGTSAAALPSAAPVRESPQTLTGVKQRLDAMARERGAPAVVSGWWVDLATRSVVLGLNTAPRDATESRYVDDARAVDPAVRVVDGVTAPTPPADPTPAPVPPGAPPAASPSAPVYDLVGGDGILVPGGRCSLAFSARTLAGAPRLITAGHCTREGGEVSGANDVPIGAIRSSVFSDEGDWGVVDVGPGWRPTPSVSGADGATISVTGTAEPPVGAQVCRSGSSTGWRCGTVTAVDVTANYSAGAVSGLVLTTACSEGGDSGGPFVAGSSAVGLLSGGTGDCTTAGGTSLYQPVEEILRREGLALEVTR